MFLISMCQEGPRAEAADGGSKFPDEAREKEAGKERGHLRTLGCPWVEKQTLSVPKWPD